jgi:hypothetical protein
MSNRVVPALLFQGVPVTDRAQVLAVVEKFRAKYGTGDVKKYYSKLVLVQMSGPSVGK